MEGRQGSEREEQTCKRDVDTVHRGKMITHLAQHPRSAPPAVYTPSVPCSR